MSWKSIKKKFEKDMLLQNFVLQLKSDNNLTMEKAQKCLLILISAIGMKQIVSSDIIMNNSEITEIKGFEIVNGKCQLSLKKEKVASRTYTDVKTFGFLGYKWREYKESSKFNIKTHKEIVLY